MMAFMQYAMQIVLRLHDAIDDVHLPATGFGIGRAYCRCVGDGYHDQLIRKPLRSFPEPFSGRVEFRNVSFRYPGAEDDVLHNITFTAEPGQDTAIIGSTGCGKSTVINLIPRFYDVTEGAIYVDGTDIREVRQTRFARQDRLHPAKRHAVLRHD